ncbi:E3 ubiquitin-protein ligase XB3 [Hordeum vulgare]|nr:E3 ubiquitin-protein ligase XB3 [Hordeum vulgare]
MLAPSTPHIFVLIRSLNQILATSLHFPSLTSGDLRFGGQQTLLQQSESVDSGVIPCGIEEAMAVRIVLHCSREDSARSMTGSVRRDSISLAQRTIGSSGAVSSRSPWPKNLSFLITSLANYESHLERAIRRGKERIRATKASITEEMATMEPADVTTWAIVEEEAIQPAF